MTNVYLNRFPLKKLGNKDKKVHIYQCNFKSPVEPGQEFYSKLNSLCYQIGDISAVRYKSNIITKKEILSNYLSNSNWNLDYQGTQILNLENLAEKQALERLERRWLGKTIKKIAQKNRIENATEGGFIWWNADKVVLEDLGWELPEAQPGEKLSGQAVWRTVSNIITRFHAIEKRLPQRILLLRDGIVQADEFEDTVAELIQEKIAVDLLGIRKSGAGRMAILPYQSETWKDASPGTAILSSDGNTFRIVTSEAKAGGSARPLQVIRDYGNAPLETLARQVDRLCMLNPASAYAYSRLPYVIHCADKMAKTVQRIGSVSCLQKVDRHKIFFV